MRLSVLLLLVGSTHLWTTGILAKDIKSKTVTSLIHAKWKSTPIVLEASEYLADENPDYFWKFINVICNLTTPLSKLPNDEARYNAILETAKTMLTQSELGLMKLALSLHIYSPKIEMYAQIAIDRNIPTDCAIVLDINNNLFCNLEDVDKYLKNEVENVVELFKIDHYYPNSCNCSNMVILYGELGTPEFSKYHKIFSKKASDGQINYIVRHYIKDRGNRKLRLSGYGVELQMKSTEYTSQDDSLQLVNDTHSEMNPEEDDEIDGFNFKQLRNLFPEISQNLSKYREYLSESTEGFSSLKAWQFQDLGLKAAARILSSSIDEVLAVLTYTAQNFPTQARLLLRNQVTVPVSEEIKYNSEIFLANLNLQPTDTALFINGLFCDIDTMDIFALVDVLRSEVRTTERLFKIGITSSAIPLLSLELSSNSESQKGFALDFRDSAVWWINDLENDRHYSHWSSSLMEMLRPTFPGMLRNVRRNLFNLILIMDPTELSSRPLLKIIESFVIHKAPVRIGIIFFLASEEDKERHSSGLALLCAYNYITEKRDSREAIGFLTDVFARIGEGEDLTISDIRSELERKFKSFDLKDVFDEESSYEYGKQLAAEFISRAGMTTRQQALLNGVPLPTAQLNSDEFEEAVLTEILHQTPIIQKAIYKGDLQDHHNVVDFLMSKPHVMPRLNQRILSTEDNIYLDMSGTSYTNITNVPFLLQLNNADLTATLIDNIKYFFPGKRNEKDSLMYTTLWVVADLNTNSGRKILLSAMKYMKSSGVVRLAFIPNAEVKEKYDINKLVLAALETMAPVEAEDYIMKLLQQRPQEYSVDDLGFSTFFKKAIVEQDANLRVLRVYCQRVFNFPISARGIIYNGRLIGPLNDNEQFYIEDLALLERFSNMMYGDKLKAILKNGKEFQDGRLTNDVIMKTVSLLGSRTQVKSRFEIPKVKEHHSVIKIPAKDNENIAMELWAIVDPVSHGAQKLGPILNTLRKILNCNIKIYLNAAEKYSDMPLKNFYRFVLEPEIQFTSSGKATPGPMAVFNRIPTTPLFTQNMQVPDNWLVESVKSIYDLDNIRLQDVDSVVHSEFELEYLLLEGHCFDSGGSPPRGLQITLGTSDEPLLMDTIVMANLGYFQLKANPGAWLINLRAGRSKDMYDMISVDGVDVSKSSDFRILLLSFQTKVIKLRVAKKSSMVHLDLLGDDDSQHGLWNSLTSSFSKGEADETLNIFSLASGHLYERFLRIMMLSVLKNTKTPVKFWFLKNYLSPAFKDFLPLMSKEYEFEYELVQYKWPRWLHQQSEKQRIIWGYKILFLDVLFPLSVKKIIFVDADQVVRADMMELYNLDLKGAPYGYTPFCESRKEMDGFRFWKQGYWKNHLQGRRYHISALYVVDLKKFRRIAAGDRLRGQYQALSQDPNSLSNLDQDLPNNMIHQVAIKSLPQEWLWCETWCDEDSKSEAKTIDLCNNPQTKEAKLSAAVRIIPEWSSYDNEIKTLQNKIDASHLAEDIDGNANQLYDTDDFISSWHSEL